MPATRNVALIAFLLLTLAGAAVAGASSENFLVREVSRAELDSLVANRNGRPLVLVYWASWCGPCRSYKEKLAAIRASYQEAELDIVGISMDADKSMLERYLSGNLMPYKSFLADQELLDILAGLPVPTTALYDKEGRLQRKFEGNVDERRLTHYVKKLFE